MHSPGKIYFLLLPLFFAIAANSQQTGFSLSTDLGLQRNFKKEQQYWAFGHTIHGHFNFTAKEGIYVWLSYYSNGDFTNQVTATAKSSLVIPQQINYTNNALMRFKHLSTGWKKYFKGAYDSEGGWSLYGYAGFGLLLGKVENTHSVPIDTNDYFVPVRSGKANFKRLTIDLGLGYEIPLGGDVYLYTEGRAWIPASDYPSKFLFVNNNAPLVGMFNGGIRILFN